MSLPSLLPGMRRAFVGLGSNLGDRSGALSKAFARLRSEPGIAWVEISPVLETAPVGGPSGQPKYLNAVAVLDTRLSPEELLQRLLAIEDSLGRVRSERWGPRTLDLDLLLYEGEVRAGVALELPHPRLEERRFVLEPLAALDPELCLPSGLCVRERLALLPL